MDEKKASILRWGVLGGIILLFVALIAYNASNPGQTMTVWNDAMTMGNKETATKHYVVYTDLFCPYCNKYANAIYHHEEDFKKEYVEEQNILYEVRMTAMVDGMHEGGYQNSVLSAEGAYCAANQNKFWDYYHAALDQLWEDYQSKGIGVSRDSEHIPELGMDYFLAIGERAKLDKDSFNSCMNNHEALESVKDHTMQAQRATQGGIPFFQFGKFQTGGFDGNWEPEHDWQSAKTMLNAGLK